MSYSLRMAHLLLSRSKLFMIVFSFLLCVQSTFAQEEKDEGKDKKFGSIYGIHTGPLLPNQIQGMTEIMPVWGVRYGLPVRKGMLEMGVANARAYGVEYYNISASIRGDYNIDDMYALIYAGIDSHYYSPNGAPFNMYFGAHVGGGFAAHLGDLLWFRTDMKFNVNPGTALYIGFGLEWRMAAGEGAGEEK